MRRRSLFFVLVLAAGCGEAPRLQDGLEPVYAWRPGGAVDSGDDAGADQDAGLDSGTPADAGPSSDSGSPDSGTADSGTADSGSTSSSDAGRDAGIDAGVPDAGTDAGFNSAQHVHIDVSNTCVMTVSPLSITVPHGQQVQFSWHNHSQWYAVDVWLSYGGGYTDLMQGATWNEPVNHCIGPNAHTEYADISTACSSYRFNIYCQ